MLVGTGIVTSMTVMIWKVHGGAIERLDSLQIMVVTSDMMYSCFSSRKLMNEWESQEAMKHFIIDASRI